MDRCSFTPALLPKTADVASGYLPLTRANLLRQGFKFLGERYGWGHSYNARDCSGFVSEVYRSFGVAAAAQHARPGREPGARTASTFTEADSHEARLQSCERLQVGDLVYIPGHVMMVIGHDRGMPYVIHDTTGITYRDEDGRLVRRAAERRLGHAARRRCCSARASRMIDRIYSILQIRRRR